MFEELKQLMLILSILICETGFSQDSSAILHLEKERSPQRHIPNPETKKKREWFAAGVSVTGYTASIIGLSNVWYKKYPQSSFHFFNDNNDWLQMDKAGHVFAAYTAGKLSMEAWRWAGVSRKERIWVGGLSGAAFMTVIEILDGFSSEWGFSPGDMTANLFGSAAFISQELAWNEQRVQIKFSFHRNDYHDAILNQRANELFGKRTSQRMLKDYNGQTYWASANIRSFFKKSKVPSWFNIAVGYSANGMFGGTSNILKDNAGNVIFDRTDIPRYRQWYIAPDIDLTRIKTKSRVLRTTLFLLNAFKFPTPAIGISQKGIDWKWIAF